MYEHYLLNYNCLVKYEIIIIIIMITIVQLFHFVEQSPECVGLWLNNISAIIEMLI